MSREMAVSPLLAQVLVGRGLTDRHTAEAFLWPKLSQLHEPDLLPDMEKAVARIRKAVGARERIVIYADYDVDGTTGAAVLVKFFEQVGCPVDTYIPHRVEEGYGLNPAAVKELLSRGMQLMITVDCGSCAAQEIAELQRDGVDVVVTDHHDLVGETPAAFALINPKVAGCRYPFRDLAGSGVAFKLAWALSQAFSEQRKVSPDFRNYLLMCLGYVALGTVADVVPLLGENRVVTRYGLTALREARNPGIPALTSVAGIGERRLRASDISFRLAPRLNAAGRMGHARETLELLTTNDPARACQIARTLEQQNTERKALVEQILQEAEEVIEKEHLAALPVIVVGGSGWHVGVLGIVAARIVDAYARPCIVISQDGQAGKGSARSIPAYHITNALSECKDLLESFGGHSQAAGIELDPGNVDGLRRRLAEHAARTLGEAGLLPSTDVDGEVLLAQLSAQAVRELEMLEPYGEQNREPVLVASDLVVAGEPRVMGSSGEHISFFVRQGGVSLRAVAFGQARHLSGRIGHGTACSLAFAPTLNEFRGASDVELIVRDIHLDG
jgi:single-stranded-DNA-specific exonuclease